MPAKPKPSPDPGVEARKAAVAQAVGQIVAAALPHIAPSKKVNHVNVYEFTLACLNGFKEHGLTK